MMSSAYYVLVKYTLCSTFGVNFSDNSHKIMCKFIIKNMHYISLYFGESENELGVKKELLITVKICVLTWSKYIIVVSINSRIIKCVFRGA